MAIFLVMFFLFANYANAETFILPSGMEYEVLDPIMRWFILPSGVTFLAEVHAAELTLSEQIEQYIYGIADKYDLNRKGLLKLAKCESNLNPLAYNPKDIDGRPKYGLFQYDKKTFVGDDVWDWKKQTEQTGKWLSKGYWKMWPWCVKNKAPELK